MKKIYLSILSLSLFSLVSWAQPTNDNVCNATELIVDGASVLYDNAGSTIETDEPSPEPGFNCVFSWCDGAGPENTSWFSFSAPSNGAVNITTCLSGNTVDTQIALYEVGNCSDFTTFTLLAANDDIPGDCSDGAQYSSTMSVDGLESGTVYYIQLDGFEGAFGNIEIAVTTGVPQSLVSFIHNSADQAMAVVDVWVNDELVVNDMNPLDLTDFILVPAEVDITLYITAFDAADNSNPYFSQTVNLDSQKDYFSMIAGIYSETGYSPAVPLSMNLISFSDIEEVEGQWIVLMGHGVTDMPTLEIEYNNGIPMIDDILPMEFDTSDPIPGGNHTMELADENGIPLGYEFCYPLGLLGNEGTSLVLLHGFNNPADNSNGPGLTAYYYNPFLNEFVEMLVGDCPIPSNDNICNAEELIVNGAPESFNSTFATVQANEPTPPNLPFNDPEADCINQWCDGENVTNTLWFYFVAPSSGSVAVSTCLPITIDTQSAVWSVGDCNDFGSLSLVGHNDDADGGCGAGDQYASAFIVGGLTAGNTYHIQVDGWGGIGGNFEIEVFDMVSVNESELNLLTVYPNPVNDQITISLPASESATFSIHDMTGKMIVSGQTSNGKTIDCSMLSSGVYHLHSVQNGTIYTTRFVKE
jgi:hypothetical protein